MICNLIIYLFIFLTLDYLHGYCACISLHSFYMERHCRNVCQWVMPSAPHIEIAQTAHVQHMGVSEKKWIQREGGCHGSEENPTAGCNKVFIFSDLITSMNKICWDLEDEKDFIPDTICNILEEECLGLWSIFLCGISWRSKCSKMRKMQKSIKMYSFVSTNIKKWKRTHSALAQLCNKLATVRFLNLT